MKVSERNLSLISPNLDLVHRDVAHDLVDALRFGLHQTTDAGGGALGDENDSGAAHDPPDEILLARVCDGLFGNDPTSLDL